MSSLSIRGLDERALAALKARAAQEDASVNSLVLRLIEQGLGLQHNKPTRQRHADLDALIGRWSRSDAEDFERATTGLRQVDPELWK